MVASKLQQKHASPMSMMNSFVSTSCTTFALYCLVLITLQSSRGVQAAECERDSENKHDSPTFLCDVDITVTRETGCTAFITERYLFPHTTGRDAYRSIPKLDELQTVNDIKLFRGGKQLVASTETTGNNEVKVIMPTSKSLTPVLFAVSYRLSSGVMRFTNTCGRFGYADSKKNIMRWRSGCWDKSFDKLRVAFSTESENGKLDPLFGSKPASGSTEKFVIVEKKDVEENVEIYVSESGEETCGQDLGCFSGAAFNCI